MARIRDLANRYISVNLRNIFANIRNPKISAEDWRREKFKMSAEEDTELRDMVAQTLESKGVLGKIRVRKCVVLVKEEVEVKS